MIFLDINTFFSPKAGGIRTYHQAKIAWFQARREHRYIVLYPGPAHRAVPQGGQVTLVEVYGPAVTRDPSGYRFLVDFLRIFDLIRSHKPDVLEAGDPWLTGLFCLALKKSGWYKGLLVSFYHSDPVPSYLEPWAERGHSRFGRYWKKHLVRMVGRLFYAIQKGYDLTAVSSKTMEAGLRSRGIQTLAYLPFGVPELFLDRAMSPGKIAAVPQDGGSPSRIRLLYAGRLDREKGIELVLEALPILLTDERVEISVIGRGGYAERFSAFKHPRFTYMGFLENAAAVRDVYDRHDILLAPGPFETFGLGVLEAMARGLRIVGPDRGGTGELLRQAESPYIFRAEDAGDFLRAVRAAIDGDPKSESERSRALALRYGTWDEAVGRMIDCYSGHITRTGSSR